MNIIASKKRNQKKKKNTNVTVTTQIVPKERSPEVHQETSESFLLLQVFIVPIA